MESFPETRTIWVHKTKACFPAVWTLSRFHYSVHINLKVNKWGSRPNFRLSKDSHWCSEIWKWSSLAWSTKCAVTSPCRGMSYSFDLSLPAWFWTLAAVTESWHHQEAQRNNCLFSADGIKTAQRSARRLTLIPCSLSPVEFPQHLRQRAFPFLGRSNVRVCELEILVQYEKREGCPWTNSLRISGNSRTETSEAPKAWGI